MISHDIKHAIAEMSKRFEARYGHLWVASNDIDDRENLREKLLQWAEEIEREGISPEMISRITEAALGKSEFSSFPPSLNRFIFLCKEMDRMLNTGSEGRLYLELKRMDERFTFIYSRLWSEQDKDKAKRRIDFWMKELSDEGIEPATIKATASRVHKKGCYSQYPPSLNQFILECLFCKIDEEFTDTDIAFIKACAKDEELHPTIKTTRQMIGSHTLKLAKDKHVRGLFEKVYIDECRAYVSNPEIYKLNCKSDAIESVIDNSDSISDSTVAEDNTDFFNKLSKTEKSQ